MRKNVSEHSEVLLLAVDAPDSAYTVYNIILVKLLYCDV